MSQEVLASAKILVVDDDVATLKLYERILCAEGYSNIIATPDPRGVLALFVEYNPDLLILDISMPYLNGFQILEILHRSQGDLSFPVLVVTALATAENRRQAFTLGAVDVVEKPFEYQELVLRVRNLLHISMGARDVEAQTCALFAELLNRTEELSSSQLELKEAQLEVIARLARAGEHYDQDTSRHTERVGIASGLIARHLDLAADDVHNLQRAAPLHDVGKIGVPHSILLKPGRLTADEYQIMQRHCRAGAELLSGGRSEIVQLAESIALAHHERWDGQGYPLGLATVDIPIQGRIVAVADVFDALTHDRPYKKAWPINEALKEIRLQAGHQFDPQVVDAFLQLPHSELV